MTSVLDIYKMSSKKMVLDLKNGHCQSFCVKIFSALICSGIISSLYLIYDLSFTYQNRLVKMGFIFLDILLLSGNVL